MFSYCLKLKTSSEIGTKSKGHADALTVSRKARKRMTKVTSKQTCIRYISTTLSYFVAPASRN
jgi:hypothetical protein